MTGALHGGNQPITGATVSLYAAGTSGYGSAGILYAQTMSNVDATGSFSFTQTVPATAPSGPPSTISATYGCPTASTTNPDPQMYLVASGGEPQGTGQGVNSAAVFAVALGKCSGVGSLFIDMNEVTSVATMAALQQYFNPVNESFGYPSTAQAIQGFANGVALIGNMVTIATGSTITTKTQTTAAGSVAGATNAVSVTVTPEAKKINVIADILAACVNNTTNTASPCVNLFTYAVPPTPAFTSQPTQTFTSITSANEDTLQALYFMMTNPASGGSATNMNGLFNLQSAYAPFTPAYTTAPTDWTIAINYTSSTACTITSHASTVKFLTGVNSPSIDASGNLWAGSIAAGGDLFEISPVGTPLTCGLGALVASGGQTTIDPNGYVWAGSGGSANLYKWSPTTGALDSTWPDAGTPLALVSDGNNNIFYTTSSNSTTFSTTNGSLNQLAGAAAVMASPTSITTQKISTIYSYPIWMAVDSSDRLWIAISHVGTPTSEAFFDVYPSNNTTGPTYVAGTSDGSHTGFETANVADANTYSPYGVAVGAATVDSANGAGSGNGKGSYQWELFTPGVTAGTVTSQDVGQEVGGLVTPRGIAVDGASNVFSASSAAATGNYVTGATTSGDYIIGEISSTGVAIASSANSGYGTVTGGYQKDPSMLPVGPRGVAVDPTGNVWFGMNSASAASIMELVGIGVPAVTPLSVAAKNGTLGQMP